MEPGVMNALGLKAEDVIAHIKRGVRGQGKAQKNDGVAQLEKHINDYFSRVKPKQNLQQQDMKINDTRVTDYNQIENEGSLQEQLDRARESNPNAQITPQQATQFARKLIAWQSRILNSGIDLSGGTSKYKDLPDKIKYTQQLIFQAVHTFGADGDLLDAEVRQYGQGPNVAQPHGTPEFMADAERQDAQREAQKTGFDNITAQGSPEMLTAWNEAINSPNALHEYDEQSTGLGDSAASRMADYNKSTQDFQDELGHHTTSLDDYTPEKRDALEASHKISVDNIPHRERMLEMAKSNLDSLSDGEGDLYDKLRAGAQERLDAEQKRYDEASESARNTQGALDEHDDRVRHHSGERDRLTKALADHLANPPDLTDLPEEDTAVHRHKAVTYQDPVASGDRKNPTQIKDNVLDASHDRQAHDFARQHTEGDFSDAHYDNIPIVPGLTGEDKDKHDQLHMDIASHHDINGKDAELTEDLSTRKNQLDRILRNKGLVDGEGKTSVDHPSFGQSPLHSEGVHPSNRSALTSAPPVDGQGRQLHKLDGVGWVHKGTVDAFRNSLGDDEGIFHPGGLVHHDDGTVSDKGLYMDRHGIHGVAPVRSDGHYTHANTGTLTSQDLRQHDLGRALNRGILGSGPNNRPHPNIEAVRTTVKSNSNIGPSQHNQPHFRISNAAQTLNDLGSSKDMSGTQGGRIPIGGGSSITHSRPSEGTKGREVTPTIPEAPKGRLGRIGQAVKRDYQQVMAPDYIDQALKGARNSLDPMGTGLFGNKGTGTTPSPSEGPSPSLEKSRESVSSIQELLKFLEEEKVK